MTWGWPRTNNALMAYALRPEQALELRKFWLSDVAPAMAEGRCLAVATRLIRKQYPHLRLLLTYCDAEERAAAYRGAGWVPQKAQRYCSGVRVNGAEVPIRTINRKGGLKAFLARSGGEEVWVTRRKWVLPLDADMAQLVARLAAREEMAVRTRPVGLVRPEPELASGGDALGKEPGLLQLPDPGPGLEGTAGGSGVLGSHLATADKLHLAHDAAGGQGAE